MVKIVIGNVYSKIVGFLPEEVTNALDDALSYKILGAKFIPSVKNKQWDGVVRLFYKYKGQSFFTGLLAIVRELLTKHNVAFELVDSRERPPVNYPELAFIAPKNYEERDYQDFTIARSQKFTRGILSVCTGGGKTTMVTRIIAKIQTYPFIFYVLTKDLMEQAHSVMSQCLNQPIGKIGDGEADIKKISVCTIQTAMLALNMGNSKFKISDYSFDDEDAWDEKGIESVEKAAKIRKLIGMARGIYVDEAHHVAARTVKEVLLASPNAFWKFGGSATPQRESGDDIMIQAMFGSKIVDISASYLIKKDWLVRPYIFFEPVKAQTDFHSYQKIYETCVVKNDEFNDHVAATANHLISRGLSVLVLVKQYSHGDYLKKLIPNSEFITGRIKKMEDRTAIIDRLRKREIMCMIATSLADEGLDIPSLDAVLMPGLGKSASRIFQRIGRTLRKDREGNKNKSIVIVYEHDSKYLFKHVQKVRLLLKREPEFVIKNSKGSNFIFGEIDEVLGLKNKQTDLFT